MQILRVKKNKRDRLIKIRGSHRGCQSHTTRFRWVKRCLTRGMRRFSSSSRGSQRVSCLIMTMGIWCRALRRIITTLAIQVLIFWNRYRSNKLNQLLRMRRMWRISHSLMNQEGSNNRKTFKKILKARGSRYTKSRKPVKTVVYTVQNRYWIFLPKVQNLSVL